MPGFYIEEYKESPFDSHEFVVQTPKALGTQHGEGHLTNWRYDLNSAAGTPPSWLQTGRSALPIDMEP